MKIEDFKDLEKLIKLCRKTGVSAIEVDNIKFNLGDEPKKAIKKQEFIVEDPLAHAKIEVPKITPEADPITGKPTSGFSGMNADIKSFVEKIATEELTEEQLLNWSVSDEQVQQ